MTTPRHESTPAKISQRRDTSRGVSSARENTTQTRGQGENGQSTANSKTGSSSKGSKRRKISHVHRETFDDPSDLLDSSPSPSSPTANHEAFDQDIETAVERSHTQSPTDHAVSVEAYERPATARDSSPLQTDEDSPGKEFATPKMRTSRFRNPMTQSSQATNQQPAPTKTEQPLPSFQSRLLAASTASSPGPHLRGPHPSLDFVLPDAFSPSRRRGHHEYIERGHAEVVRNWVLDIAARSGVGDMLSMNRQQPPDIDANTFKVKDIVHRDGDDRFAIVSTDDHEYTWMLVDTDPKSRAILGVTHKSRIERLHEGSRFVLKGGQVSNWMLNARNERTSNEISTDDQPISTACRVVVLWDLIH